MDFDSELTQIQGILMKADNSFSFKNIIPGEDDYEDNIKNIIKYLHDLLKSKKYLVDDYPVLEFDPKLRRITFFIILNSDLDILNVLVNNDNVGHLIWATPTLTKNLFINLIWSLNLQKFYAEAVSFCCPQLSLELLKIATQNMKLCNAEKAVECARCLIAAIYKAITRILLKKENFDKDLTNGFYENFIELIKYFTGSPNQEEISKWKKRKMYIHAGKTLLSLLELNIECFDVYSNKSKPFDSDIVDIYSLTDGDVKLDKNIAPGYVENIIDGYLTKFNNILLDSIKDNLTGLNIDLFCSWSEHDYDDSRTLQQVIGETTYKFHNMIVHFEFSGKELLTMLESIASKPLELEDVIRDADENLIVYKAGESSEEQKQWLLALIEKDYLFTNSDAIDRVQSNIDLLPLDSRKSLFCRGVNYIDQDCNGLKMLLLKCFSSLGVEYKMKILHEVFRERPLDDRLELPDFDVKFVEVLNKFVNVNDETISTFADFFIQNPSKFYMRIFQRCSKNKHDLAVLDALYIFHKMNNLILGDFYSDMKTIIDISRFEVLTICTLKEIDVEQLKTDSERDSFLNMIKDLVNKAFASSETIIFKYLMNRLDDSLSGYRYDNSILYFQCLKEIFDVESLISRIPPLLVQTAYIMEAHRWNVLSYTTNRVRLLELVLDFQRNLLESFLKSYTIKDKEYRWVVSKLEVLSPINFIYFNDVLLTEKLNLCNYQDSQELKIKLCYLLPKSTLDEWKTIYSELILQDDELSIRNMFFDIMTIIISTVNVINVDNAYNCLEYCCRNFSILLREFENQLKNPDDCCEFVEKIIYIVDTIPDVKKSACFNMFLTPLSRTIESLKKTDHNMDKITILFENLDDVECKNILKNLVENTKQT